MNIWLKKKSAIPRIFIIIVIERLWRKGYGKRTLFKWILPLLSSDDGFDNTFGIKDLVWMKFAKCMS